MRRSTVTTAIAPRSEHGKLDLIAIVIAVAWIILARVFARDMRMSRWGNLAAFRRFLQGDIGDGDIRIAKDNNVSQAGLMAIQRALARPKRMAFRIGRGCKLLI
jgi:hypothetical protein